MKFSTTTLAVLASSGQAFAAWTDWIGADPTVTTTVTNTWAFCPCDGKVTPVAPTKGWPKPTQKPDPGQTVTKAGPIVVVFETEGSMTTKTGVAIELIIEPTQGGKTEYVTKTVWTGPQPTDDLEWIDWDETDPLEGATLTRTHTKITTVYDGVGSVPTGGDNAFWEDWAEGKSTTTSSRGVGPVGGSTTSRYNHWSSSTWSTTTSYGNGVGPIGGSTSTSASTAITTSYGNGVGPIGGSTSTSASTATTTSYGNGVGPIGGSTSTTASSASSATTATTATTTSNGNGVGPIGGSTSTSSTTSATSEVPTTSTTTSTTTAFTSSTTTTSANGGLPTVTDDVRALDYQSGILEAHNVHRANHSAANLVWNDQLAAYAAQTAAKCVYAHDLLPGGGGYGQNIGAGYTANTVPRMIGNDMYNAEMPNYPLPYGVDNVDMTNFYYWGHFSQIVWASTTSVGCATGYCANLQGATYTNYFTICNYYPPGNINGAYANVGAPLGHDVVIMVTNN